MSWRSSIFAPEYQICFCEFAERSKNGHHNPKVPEHFSKQIPRHQGTIKLLEPIYLIVMGQALDSTYKGGIQWKN